MVYTAGSWDLVELYHMKEGFVMIAPVFLFPAVRGYQAKKEYYISMVPLEVIPRIFQFIDEDLPPEIRAQRVLNKARIPEITNYIIDNDENYVFSSLTVSVDGDMNFMPVHESEPLIGHISIPMNARFLINDGQHRRAAIAEALKQNSELKKEDISVVFYRDMGLKKSQQIFSDLNRYAMRPTRSINILYNSREDSSIIAKEVIERVSVFHGFTEKEKTTISNRSKALFTLSAICTSTELLLNNVELDIGEKTELAVSYWNMVAEHITEWRSVKNGLMKASDVRTNYICTLSITMAALGYGGNVLIKAYPNKWKSSLSVLNQIGWGKDNPKWHELVFINGKVVANRATQQAMSKYIEYLLLSNVGDD
jgi:DNA sulfur modification protein DndB